ncbi:MAG: hypothetical protein GAK32_00952 [Pseudomonas fluorescens]|nr:MAG: hypothetical protein GAK32_00952 [Pseudomonas fluorescens]
MLMIFIGPLISQAMPMDHHAGMNMQPAGCHGEPQHPAAHRKAPAEHHVLWEKCGYCSLLFSCPALPGSVSFIAPGAPSPANAISPAPHLGHARQAVFPGARSRAPPVIA